MGNKARRAQNRSGTRGQLSEPAATPATAATPAGGGRPNKRDEPARQKANRARRAFERLLFDDDAKEHLAELRSASGFGSGRDLCEVRIWIPAVRSGEPSQDTEDLYARQLAGRPGTIEDLVLRVNALCDQIDPGGALDGESADDSGRSNGPERAPGLPAAEADTTERSEKADDTDQVRGGDALEDPVTRAADDEDEEGGAVASLRELMKDLPIDRQLFEYIVDVPAARDVLRGLQLQLRRTDLLLAGVRKFVAEISCEDDGPDNDLICREIARRDLGEVKDLLDELGTELFCYLDRVGAGRLIELDDETLAATRELSRSAPCYHRQPHFLVSAAVQYVAGLPNRGGVLAAAEQSRLRAIDPTYREPPRPGDRAGWPWKDAAGQPLTVESEYEPSGDLAEWPKPRAQSA